MNKVFIQMISGTFGLLNGTSVERKTSKDDPFEVDEATANRLIKAKVAKLAEKPSMQSTAQAEQPEEDFSETTKFDVLVKIAAAKGIEVPSSIRSKKDLYAFIKAHDEKQVETEASEETESTNELPDLGGDDAGAVVQ